VSIIAYARPLPGTDLADLGTLDLTAAARGVASIPTQRTAPAQRTNPAGAELGARVFNLCHHRAAAGMPYPDLAEIAGLLGVTEQTVGESIRAFFDATGVDRDGTLTDAETVRGLVQMAPCPPWCTNTHPTAPAGIDPTDLDAAFDYSRLHERFVANVISRDAQSARPADLMHNAVEVEAFESFDGTVVEPPSVTLTLHRRGRGSAGGDGGHEQSRLTPEQAEELGLALIEAARMVRVGR
jgi:hypothetical protein